MFQSENSRENELSLFPLFDSIQAPIGLHDAQPLVVRAICFTQ
jgi:hypothetical protein